MKRRLILVVAISSIAIAAGLSANRWLIAKSASARLPDVVHSKAEWAGHGALPAGWGQLPAGFHPTTQHKFTASAQLLPGRRVKVTAQLDADSKPDGSPHLYMWKLEFLSEGQNDAVEPAWFWVYDQRPLVAVTPGIHKMHEFTDTVTLPPGEYLGRVWLLHSTWEDTVDGLQLTHQDPGTLMRSFRVSVPQGAN